jgi:hypothetical protein
MTMAAWSAEQAGRQLRVVDEQRQLTDGTRQLLDSILVESFQCRLFRTYDIVILLFPLSWALLIRPLHLTLGIRHLSF